MPAWRMDKGATNQCNGRTMAYQPQPLLSSALYHVTNQSTNQPQPQAPATFPWLIVGAFPSSKFWDEEPSMMNCNKIAGLYESIE